MRFLQFLTCSVVLWCSFIHALNAFMHAVSEAPCPLPFVGGFKWVQILLFWWFKRKPLLIRCHHIKRIVDRSNTLTWPFLVWKLWLSGLGAVVEQCWMSPKGRPGARWDVTAKRFSKPLLRLPERQIAPWKQPEEKVQYHSTFVVDFQS